MRLRVAALVVLVLVGCAMLTNRAYRRRSIVRDLAENVEGTERYVDMSVDIITVVGDPKGKRLIPGKPPLRELRRVRLGGIVDTKRANPEIVRYVPLSKPASATWYCSEDQARVIFHDDPVKAGQLVYGSEGAGKTRVLGMWLAVQGMFKHLGQGREFGFWAPTEKRIDIALTEMRGRRGLYPHSWFTYSESKKILTFADGTRIRMISTYRQSQAQGAPGQGFNLSGSARDEGQDQVEAHEDIESRGRDAVDGRYPQLITATAKDDSAWRELRDMLLASGTWEKQTLSIFRSPFIAERFLADKARSMSVREFKRRYGDPRTGDVFDLPPELAVYYGWLRERNLVALPQIAKDVTGAVLEPYPSYLYPGRQFGLLIGHDPGVIYNTSTVLKLLMFGEVPTWMVVGELQTKQTTARQHAQALAKYLRDEFYVHHATIGGPLPMAFLDPHGKGEGQTDFQSVYMAFQKEGIDVFNPAGIVARIQRKARVEMINRLLGGSGEEELTGRPAIARLVVAADHQGKPVAPRLVEAFESLKKKPGDDDPEGSQTKNVNDKTHAPAATSYALWQFEQEAFTDATVRTARRAAGLRV